MVGSSKVLTVSYGTFSCTLEGFDDSFDTMKAIAEYFRDLAADDRYFGAEPPTPDADMLARIAEREIARRVEARMSDGGIHLRAADATMPRARVAATPARVAPTTAPQSEPTMPPAAAVQSEPAVPRAASQPSESVAAKLQRIRSVVGKSAVQPAEFIEDLAPSQEFVEAEEIETLTFDYEGEPEEALVEEAETALTLDTEIEEPLVDEVANEDEVSEEPVLEETLEEDASIASILSEVDEEEQEEIEQELADVDEDAAPELEMSNDDELLSRLTSDLEEDDDEDEVQDEALELVEPEAPADDITALLSEEAEEDDTLAQEVAAAVEPEVPAVKEPEAPKDLRTLARNRVRVIRMKRASEDFERTLASEPSDTSIFADAEDDVEKNEPAAISAQPDVNLADLDGLDEFEVASDALSDEEEAELLRELSQIEDSADEDNFDDEDDFEDDHDELDEFEDEYEVEAAQEKAPVNPIRRLGRALLDQTPDQTDDLNRIADRADEQLREPESNRRREAFSQLKAAVAATEAARALGEQEETVETRENPFRRVLDQVVRPGSAKTEDERPRPAPLKLVASQRVDVAKVETPAAPVQPSRPVMPRRIAAQSNAVRKEEVEITASGFAQFASDMGAESVDELLEAAAAHTTFVEGLEDFSRPQVMRKLMEVDTFDREDSLRAFGTLLREGRILKVRNGRFAISDDTDFRP